MRRIFEFVVKQPLFVNLLTLLVVVAGMMAMLNLNRDVFPNIQLDIVIIQTAYPGSTPKEIEKLITIPIEKELKEVSDIKEMTSISLEGASTISIEIDPDAPDKSKVVTDIQRAVDRVDDLPDDLKDKPIVTEIETRNRPAVELSLSGDLSLEELSRHAEALETRILDLPDIAKVSLNGWRDREIWVEVDPQKVSELYLSLAQVVEALKERNVSIPGGTIFEGGREYLVRTVGEFMDAEGTKPVVIRANERGHWIRLSDIARVTDTFEPFTTIQRTNGHRAINLVAVKKERGDVIDVVDELKELVANYKTIAPTELDIRLVNDMSYYVQRRLNVLKSNGYVGFVLVLVCLFLFLTTRIAIATAVGIPIAFLTTFLVMQYAGITINLITMFGLIMVLGMIVDDAIIIAENVHRHIEDGMPIREAGVAGAYDVWRPVAATVITTIAAFAPLMFMTGIMGKFIRFIPLVVILALISSLLEAFIILPSHLVELERLPRMRAFGRLGNEWFTRWFDRQRDRYVRWLGTLIRHRWPFMSGVVFFFVMSLYVGFVHLPFVLFPQKGIEAFFVRAKAPVGTPVEEMERRMEPLERLIEETLPQSEWDDYVTHVGIQQNDDIDPFGERASHVGQILIHLKPSTQREMTSDELVELLRARKGELTGFTEVIFEKVRHGPPVGKSVVIRVRGDDFDILEAASEKIKQFLTEMPGVSDAKDTYEPGKDEIRVVVDDAAASRAGLSVQEVALAVRTAFDGMIATTVKKTDEEIDVRVRYPDASRYKEGAIEGVMIPNGNGNLIPIISVASFARGPGINAIRHYDRKRTIIVSASVDEKRATSISATEAVDREFHDIGREFPGVTLNYGGEWESTQESFTSLKIAMVMAAFIIFIVLAFQFQSLLQPVIVMLAVPYGFVGIVWAFFFHLEPKSFLAMVGAVGLAGVVVNNSIVLIDFTNKAKARGMTLREAIVEAARIRLRPIILTTVTTVLGLLPVAYGIMGFDPFIAPMALAIGWGLAFATLCTLFVTPCLYAAIDDVHCWAGTHVPFLRCDRERNAQIRERNHSDEA